MNTFSRPHKTYFNNWVSRTGHSRKVKSNGNPIWFEIRILMLIVNPNWSWKCHRNSSVSFHLIFNVPYWSKQISLFLSTVSPEALGFLSGIGVFIFLVIVLFLYLNNKLSLESAKQLSSLDQYGKSTEPAGLSLFFCNCVCMISSTVTPVFGHLSHIYNI